MSKSQEGAATTSNTLLLDNLESSFSWVTWLRRCHRLPNQYWKLSWLKCLPPQWQQLWPNTLLTCLRDGNYFGSAQLLALHWPERINEKKKKSTGPEQSIHQWAWPLHFKWWGHWWLKLDNETCKNKFNYKIYTSLPSLTLHMTDAENMLTWQQSFSVSQPVNDDFCKRGSYL